MLLSRCAWLLAALAVAAPARAGDGNRLAYLDELNPYYPHRTFPKLTTPMWVGEESVEAVVILAIDDMRGHEKWETFLRPILERLKRIDGRAPVSIMTCTVDPAHPHLQQWLKEGLSLEVHTVDHPCPLLRDGDLKKAKSTYDRCVDLLNQVPGNKPVCFRMPCCDSLNTVSPRFFSEIFNKTTEKGHFLLADSSVFNVLTANDPALPRELVIDADGRDRFRKYLPLDRNFVNYVEDYPYPYVIGNTCWEFPCVTPSDWQAQYLHKPNNPITVRDWQAALDATVIKQGVFPMVFHPHGWIKAEQMVDLIDYAVARHGKKVKFLTFKEAVERLNKNVLGGRMLRHAKGRDNGLRLLDIKNNGRLSVFLTENRGDNILEWNNSRNKWDAREGYPIPYNPFEGYVSRFGVLQKSNEAVVHNGWAVHFLTPRNEEFHETNGQSGQPWQQHVFRDLDGDGICERIEYNYYPNNPELTYSAVLRWKGVTEEAWETLPFKLPPGAMPFVSYLDHDNGLRFIDINEDGKLDVVFSNEEGFGVYLFTDMEKGWSQKVIAGKRGDPGALPLISKNGTNNGFFVHSRALWWQNEDTALLPNHVARRTFNELLAQVEPTAKTPEASLKSIQARPGFTVEQVAAEPLVQSPVAFAWGPDGKLWVVEMGDYPLGVNGGKPGSRVKFLESTKGDGKYDKATVFLDGLPFATGVLPWRKGVLITSAPDILYAEDTDGDGKADKKEVLYTGFTPGNPQHRVNSLVWGLDNWIHVANGDSGGQVKSLKTGKVVDIRGRDLRIRPDSGDLEATTGQTQYGTNRDDWDNWFGNNNTNPMFHYVLPDHYLRRNPHVAPPDPRVNVSVTPGSSPVYPISRTLPRFNSPEQANHFTSACSAMVYRDDLFGPQFADNAFVSEPVHNLVHREVMSQTGVTFTSRRAPDEQQAEFLASADNWFRPTMIQTGPDGALWVADMYRQVIEHPQWIPLKDQLRLDLRAGHDKGRLYRVFPVGKAPRPIPRLDKLDAAGLVAALDSPNGWQRDMAHMMLVGWKRPNPPGPPSLRGKGGDRPGNVGDSAPRSQPELPPLRLGEGGRGGEVLPSLEALALACPRPQTRGQALCVLEGLGALRAEVLGKALADAHPGVRKLAIRCAEGGGLVGELAPHLDRLVNDPDPTVRMQLAFTLGYWDDPRAGQALGRLALRDGSDRFMLAAVLSSATPANLEPLLLAVLEGSKSGPPPVGMMENLLRLATAFNKTEVLTKLLAAVATPENGRFAAWQFAAFAGLLDALDQRKPPAADLSPKDRLAALFAAARKSAADGAAPPADRTAAVRLLGRDAEHRDSDIAALAVLLTPQTPDTLQAAAVASLGRLGAPALPALLRGWKAYSPGRRGQVLDLLLQRPEGVAAVLAALEKKDLLPLEIDAARRQRLLDNPRAEVRDAARKLLEVAGAADRQAVVERYRPAATLQGDPARGKTLFARHCAACHKFQGVGEAVGPDLASLADKSPESLLVALLDPNRAVEARYLSYVALTKDGRTWTGLISAETGTSITLTGPDGKPQVLLRADVEEFRGTGKSLMPEGLEKDLNAQDVADVLAHLRGAGQPRQRRTFAASRPEVVRPAADGALTLRATSAEIYGSTVVLEDQYKNLGYWMSEADEALWTLEVPKEGKYAVVLDYACDHGAAGNRYLIEAAGRRLTGTVTSTGTWDDYKQAKVGTLTLTAGRHTLAFRSAGAIKGSLIDLRGIRLVPE